MDTTIKSLENQWSLDSDLLDYQKKDIVYILKSLGICERGGGPEGLYYTHPLLDGEYLYRNLPKMLKDISKLLPPFINYNDSTTW